MWCRGGTRRLWRWGGGEVWRPVGARANAAARLAVACAAVEAGARMRVDHVRCPGNDLGVASALSIWVTGAGADDVVMIEAAGGCGTAWRSEGPGDVGVMGQGGERGGVD